MEKATCTVLGCERLQRANRMCMLHYDRMRRTGTTDERKKVNGGPCKVEGCESLAQSKGYCKPHYRRLWRTGEVSAEVPLRAPHRQLPPPEDHADGTRTCRECGKRKPLGMFPKDPRGRLGHRPSCKVCHCAAEMARYAADPEVARERMRQQRANNPDDMRARDSARYERDKDKRIAAAVEASHRRRARLKDAPAERGITVAYLRRRDGDACFYCDVEMVFAHFKKGERPGTLATIEHRMPISRGGGHTDSNCVLSCWRCNISKGKLTEEEWDAKRGKAHRLRLEGDRPGMTA